MKKTLRCVPEGFLLAAMQISDMRFKIEIRII